MAEVRTPRTKLKEMRERMGLFQQELADMAGMSRSRYAEIERGEANISDEQVGELLGAFCIKRDRIVSELHATIYEIQEEAEGWNRVQFGFGRYGLELFRRDPVE